MKKDRGVELEFLLLKDLHILGKMIPKLYKLSIAYSIVKLQCMTRNYEGNAPTNQLTTNDDDIYSRIEPRVE